MLYEGDRVVDGAVDAVAGLRRASLTLRFLTNTTTRPRRQIVERMRRMGFEAEVEHVFTPAIAAAVILRAAGSRRLQLAAPSALKEDFADFEIARRDVDAVVMGDLYEKFTWRRLNSIFQACRDGARLLALHKNRYCRRDDAIGLDLGPFVAAVEYAADIEAQIVGKPATPFFAAALADMGLERGEVLMVGDDVDADIGGARRAGIRAVQVRTGKYDAHHAGRHRPDALIDSIADLGEIIDTLA
ncbi:MAG: TIGR01458 family HAD-type hydrolase [Gammaproteobacteria bacterium]|nr:TIGR01458 family HAD-type hydrolase [Gammaproteobacteria bacterium]